MSKNFTVYRSSAGSGKTYSLVKEYIRTSLVRPDDFRNILAVTFTNKAANEMKSRVLEYLQALSDPDAEPGSVAVKFLLPDLVRKTGMDRREIVNRSRYLLTAILHHYADFSISTIDSFMHRVVRSFAFDLHRPVDFEVVLEEERLLEEVVDLLISRAGTDDLLTEALVRIVEKKTGEDKSWNIEYDLKLIAGLVLTEDAIRFLPLLRPLTVADYLATHSRVRKWMNGFLHSVKETAQDACNHIQSKQLEGKAFSGGKHGIYGYFRDLAADKWDKLIPTEKVLKNFNDGNWHGSKSSPAEMDAVKAIIPLLSQSFLKLQHILSEQYSKYILYSLIDRSLLPMAVIGEIEKVLEAYKGENKMLLISEFNQLIFSVVREQPAPFIYERLGERYHHYFIDEFQDTSLVQWHNLVPLLENALSAGHFNLVVGDGKQAIYRWRSGDVEQFMLLPRLKGSGEDEIIAAREQALERNFQEITLDNNFRSLPVIVDFNNRLFEYVREILPERMRGIYKDVRQKASQGDGGFVRIDFLEGGEDKAAFGLRVLQTLPGLIARLRDDGYSFREITLLFRDNKTASKTAAWLMQHGIPVVSPESVLLRNSREVNFLLAWFRLIDDQSDRISLATILAYLDEHPGQPLKLHTRINSLDGPDAVNVLLGELIASRDTGGSFTSLKGLDIVSLAEALIRLFELNVPADPFLQFFQDAVLQFSGKTYAQLNDFLDYWEDQSGKLSIKLPAETDAVRVMTIHKAKGLEFPVVIFPFADDRVPSKMPDQWVTLRHDEVPPLKAALLPFNKKLVHTRFESDWQLESDKYALDTANLLYVALTRAIERLYIVTPLMKKPGEDKISFPHLLAGFATTTGLWNGTEGACEFGMPVARPAGGEEKTPLTSVLQTYCATDWSGRIRLRASSPEFWRSMEDDAGTNFGRLLHHAMAGIRYKGDEVGVLRSILESGMIDEEQSRRLDEDIRRLLEHPMMSRYLDPAFEILNEQEIIAPKGVICRPDRLMIKGQSAVVLDYKTGKPDPAHEEQVRNYARLLKDMGYTVEGAFLAYIREEPVIAAVELDIA